MRTKYYLKTNPKAFFRPKDWLTFYNALKEKSTPYFQIAINTGARINEIRHLKVKDIDFDNRTLTFYVTKKKAKLKETRSVPREIKISSEFMLWLKRWIRKHNLKPGDTFDIPTTPGVRQLIKERLDKMDIKDSMDFSSHNVRKTHGTWLLATGMDGIKVASRLGHDYNTLLKSYVSPDIFTHEDKVLIRQILGDLVQF